MTFTKFYIFQQSGPDLTALPYIESKCGSSSRLTNRANLGRAVANNKTQLIGQGSRTKAAASAGVGSKMK